MLFFIGYRLIVTGHSLGAGTAQLITMDLLNQRPIFAKNPDISCVALAPPPIFRPTRRKVSSKFSNAIDIYINSQDCVPRMSLASMAKLLAMVRAVDAIEMSAMDKFKVKV